ncbi:MAG: hypothetical protein U5R06_14355 [candidate division KSB1 bacterium]|nr:hypothetical protein [candidate division KSB1 bacterium]
MKKTSLIILMVAFLMSCSLDDPFGDKRVSEPVGNHPPDTHLFLMVDQQQSTVYDTLDNGDIVSDFYTTGLDTTPSKQVLHWWGDDPDGQVMGYFYQWDFDPEPTYTTQESDTFYVPIRTDYDEFSFSVWAVDDQGLEDPEPVTLRFPVFNSPPTIMFALNSNPQVRGNANVTSYTFPTRTFIWDAQDPDGRETITHIEYALDDTSEWQRLDGSVNQITLRDISPGEHRFFVRAVDISGATSDAVSFPDPTDPNVPNRWQVKEPKGDILLVNDYAQDQTKREIETWYTDILDQLVSPEGYSIWEIGSVGSPSINAQNTLPYSSIDIQANLGYFDKVIWFSHLGRPNLTDAGLSITRFVKNGGHIFISNGNEERPDTTWTFTDIDSVYRLNPGGRLFSGVRVNASFETASDSLYDLELGQLLGNRVSALIPGSQSDVIYRMQHDSTTTMQVPYSGAPAVGLRYRVGEGACIYFSLPFHFCYGRDNVVDVMRYILFEEFGP